MVLYLSDDLSLEITSELGDSLEVVVEKDLMEAIKRMAVLVKKNSHLNFLKETVLGDKEQGVGIMDKSPEPRLCSIYMWFLSLYLCLKILLLSEHTILVVNVK